MLIVVRHGRTVTNAEGRLLGRSDPALDDVGRRQAAAVADALGPVVGAARIVTSPLLRARETAAIIHGGAKGVEVDERWIELDYGEFEGRPLSEVPEETWQQWRTDWTFAPPGGETLRALGERVESACEELRDEIRERDVIVVTHVSPVKAATVWALGVGDEVTWRTYVAPGSITRIGAHPAGAVLLSFNEIPHAPGPATRN